uniref:Ionotropic receptor n=2 Tax=Semiothisa cinerearia TaxID=2249628 RepID=A0A889XLG0_9NEOP|nr:ionotropic receptor [Semiothisa cinerearia]
MKLVIILTLIGAVLGFHRDKFNLVKDYFSYKAVKYVCYLSCEQPFHNTKVVKELILINIRTSVFQIDKDIGKLAEAVFQSRTNVGILMDGACTNTPAVLNEASESILFDATHSWLIFAPDEHNSTDIISMQFQNLNLSIDADIAVVSKNGIEYHIFDVFNFGKIQGNSLEIMLLGSWRPDNGLIIYLQGFKYYNRWDFHNLTLRAISVMLGRGAESDPRLLADAGHTPGVVAMTKVTSQLLNLLKEHHHFRFRYTIVDRWIGDPKPNSTLAVTNSLYWKEQDISSTSARIFPQWLDWVDICFPPTTTLETKFYYLMLEEGVGRYENRFLTPMSAGVWWSTLAASAGCAAVLAAAARLEARAQPAVYALFSVTAALFQQDFEDGGQERKLTSQGRKLTLLVVGVTSMLLYNYYTSSVVSWLLSAAPPSLTSLDQLIQSDLELVFEDIGYTRGWLQNPGFYYYSGYVNPKEDRMREVKVTKAKRTVEPLQSVGTGIELIRTGLYAYHTEPYTASREVSPRLGDEEVCALAALPLMLPAHVYIMVQKHSPYREFFIWSLMRMWERGHVQASRRRFPASMPACSGRRPRALALGQAAPAFLALLQLSALAALILLAECACHRFQPHHLEFRH